MVKFCQIWSHWIHPRLKQAAKVGPSVIEFRSRPSITNSMYRSSVKMDISRRRKNSVKWTEWEESSPRHLSISWISLNVELGPIQPSSPYTKELHGLIVEFFLKKLIQFIFNFLFHKLHDKFDRQIIVSNQINQTES